MKFILTAIAICTISNVAAADVLFTPLAGYNFTSGDTENKQEIAIGAAQKNDGLYGAELTYRFDSGVSVSAEAVASQSNIDSEQYSLKASVPLVGFTYLSASAGYQKMDSMESPLVAVGVGRLWPVSNIVSFKGEVRSQYNTEHNFWSPQALVGLEINLGNQWHTPYIKYK